MSLLSSYVSCWMCQNPRALTVLLPGPLLRNDYTASNPGKKIHCSSCITPGLLPGKPACSLLVLKAADPLSLGYPLGPTPLHMQAPLGPPPCPVGLGHWYNHTATPVIPFAAISNVLCLWLKSLMSSVSLSYLLSGRQIQPAWNCGKLT